MRSSLFRKRNSELYILELSTVNLRASKNKIFGKS